MTIGEVIRRIGVARIVPVVRAANADEASRAVDAIYAGGLRIVEITMTIPNSAAVIREVVDRYASQVLIGAGTVLTSDQAELCIDAGAEFLVSPGISFSVLETARKYEKLAIPGVLTPSEVMNAKLEGASLVKIFPCGNVGGPKYLKAMRAPFPDLAMIPTGGVNTSNARDYFAAGAFALGVGADLVDVDALRNGNTNKIVATARELVDAVRNADKFGFHPTTFSELL